MAVWADGTTHKIMQITVADAREIISGGGKRSCYPAEVVWSGEHGVTHHKLTVKRRADRGLLMSLYEQEAQVCSVKVEWVGQKHTPLEPESKVAEDKAGEMMTIVAKEYAANKLETDMLYKRRDELLEQANICKRKFTPKQIAFARSNGVTTELKEFLTSATSATEAASGSAASSRRFRGKSRDKGGGMGSDTADDTNCKKGRHEGGKGVDIESEGVDLAAAPTLLAEGVGDTTAINKKDGKIAAAKKGTTAKKAHAPSEQVEPLEPRRDYFRDYPMDF